MSRSVLAVLGVIALVAGIAVGILAGSAGQGPQGPSPSAIAVASPTPSTPTPVAPSGPPATAPATPSPTPVPTPTPEPTPSPEPTPVRVPAPLTGEPVREEVAERPVIAVMIDDLWAARPQSGLSSADVVWHAPAEGGIPRYMALFQTRYPRLLGPVRSARLYYIGWAAEWRAVFVHAGGSKQAVAFLNSRRGRARVHNADWNVNLYRVTFRGSPHNLYTDGQGLRRIPASVGVRRVRDQAPVWTFAPDAPLEARPSGGRIVVPYKANEVTYHYHRGSNTYRRSVSIEGRQFDPATDPRTRIAPSNVIIMKVPLVPTGDRKGHLDGEITGSGPAWIATNGVTVKGEWRKRSFGGPTRFFGPDGQEVTLTMGQTFIQVVTRTTRITVEDGEVPTPGSSPTPSPTTTP
jgi:hypothetical protein